MLAPRRTWTFDEAGWEADLAQITAEQRARGQLKHDRERFWERMMDELEDFDRADGDRPANRRGN